MQVQRQRARTWALAAVAATLVATVGFAGIVHFAPRARTHWHAHPGGQFLYGVTGRGWIRSRDDEGAWLEPGDVLWVAPGEWHFHSAGPDTPLVHVAVNGGGAPDWESV